MLRVRLDKFRSRGGDRTHDKSAVAKCKWNLLVRFHFIQFAQMTVGAEPGRRQRFRQSSGFVQAGHRAGNAPTSKYGETPPQRNDFPARSSLGRVRPCSVAFLKLEKTRDHFLHVIPVAGIICLNEKRPARRQSAMNQDKKLRRHKPASDLTRIEVRLGMVTVNLSHAARLDMIAHETRGVAHRESEVAEAALVASSH